MEFLNPKHRKRHFIQLYVGYVLMVIAVGLAAFILLLVAFGFGIGTDGQLVQKGLLFASSRPGGAEIYMDGVQIGETTDARLNLTSKSYLMQLKRDGYRVWQRKIDLFGGEVLRIDYPLLIPLELKTQSIKSYQQKPPLVMATPNNHWLLTLKNEEQNLSFDMFDTTKPQQEAEVLNLTSSLYASASKESWKLISWADQDHALIQHNYGSSGKREFILFDRSDPSQSINLNSWFGRQFGRISFIDNNSDQFYLYDEAGDVLYKATLDQPEPKRIAGNILAYESYGADGLAYVNRTESEDGKQVLLQVKDGAQTTVVRQLPLGGGYKLAVSRYDGNFYLAAAAKKLGAAYIYKNPVQQITDQNNPGLEVGAVLPMKNPSYLSSSDDGRMLLSENNRQFAVYDALYKRVHSYDFTKPLDKYQKHATWLDGTHLQYVSNGQLFVFDFDGKNQQILVPAISNTSVYYGQEQASVFSLVLPEDSKNGEATLTFTSLRTPADQ